MTNQPDIVILIGICYGYGFIAGTLRGLALALVYLVSFGMFCDLNTNLDS